MLNSSSWLPRVAVLAATGLLGLWLLLALLAHFHDPLDTETQVWLATPVPYVEPARNGYVDQISLDSSAIMPATSALEWLGAAQALHAGDVRHAVGATTDVYARLYQHFMDPVPLQLPDPGDCRQDCYGVALARRAEIEPALTKLALPMQRFDSMLAKPAYAEAQIPDSASIGVGYQTALALDRLYLCRLAYRLEAGQGEAALGDWQRRQRFWLGVTEHATSLYNQQQALGALMAGDQFLAQLLVRHPELLAAARSQALPLLGDDHIARQQEQLGRIFVLQLRYAASDLANIGLSGWLAHDDHEAGKDYYQGLRGFVRVTLYQPGASVELQRQVYANAMADMGLSVDGMPLRHQPVVDRICSGGFWWWPLNGLGQELVCSTANGLPVYGQRLQALAAGSRVLREGLQVGGDAAAFRTLAERLHAAWL